MTSNEFEKWNILSTNFWGHHIQIAEPYEKNSNLTANQKPVSPIIQKSPVKY